MRPSEYVRRLADVDIEDLFASLPALMITGPRGSGKTTTARRHVQTVVRLDSPVDSALFRADPDFALASQSLPVLLDEWQAVPEVLGAVKRAVDDVHAAGRFILTGSVRARVEAPMWPGTGRVIPLSMFGLTQREIAGRLNRSTFLDKLAEADVAAFARLSARPDLGGYVDLALRGGFPDAALRLSERERLRWLEGYVDQVVSRDVEALSPNRDPVRLRRYIEAFAANTAGVVEDQTLYVAAGVDKRTADAYERLLANLFIVERVPAWSSNRLQRLMRRPKRFLVDPALLAPILGIDRHAVLRSSDLLGRLIETFVLSQIRPELALSRRQPRLYHLRHRDLGREIDLVAEMAGQAIVGIEVKATSAPSRSDARHLVWLRDQLGSQFLAGAVLHTGPHVFPLGERILALPICVLWQ